MELLAWDKEKHTILANLEIKMHKESLDVHERVGADIALALKDVGLILFRQNYESDYPQSTTHHNLIM